MMKLGMGVATLAALVAVPALAQRPAAPVLGAEQSADRQVWIDEHARWNAEHTAAARRLEAVAQALKQHNTGFDLHGQELRQHGTLPGGAAAATAAHPRLRTAHEQARNVHDDLMTAVEVLERVLRKNLGQNQSFPSAPQRDEP